MLRKQAVYPLHNNSNDQTWKPIPNDYQNSLKISQNYLKQLSNRDY